MKKNIGLLTACMILLVAGCANGNEGAKEKDIEEKMEDEVVSEEEDFKWTVEDVSFYSHFGEEELYFTENKTTIKLSDGEGLKTIRDVKIQDSAKKSLEKYDLTDFNFQFSAGFGRKSDVVYENEDALTEEYSGVSVEEMLERLDEVKSSYGVNFYYFVELYELDAKVYTKSTLPGNDFDFAYDVFIYIKDGKIEDISMKRYWGNT